MKHNADAVTRLKLTLTGLLCGAALFIAFAVGRQWHWLVAFALLMSWLGDALMARVDMFVRRIAPVDPFIAGMGAFAVAQVLYTIAFWVSMKQMPLLRMTLPGALIGQTVLPMVWPVYFLMGLFFWVWVAMRAQKPTLLKAGTLVYCCLLTTMASFAFSAAFTGTTFIWPLVVGGTLFVISDGFIAVRTFKGWPEQELRYQLLVWGTYWPAQLFLLIGSTMMY